MPNVLGPTGLSVQTHDELVTYYTAQFQLIYGANINLDQDSPDGQMMNIFIQAVLDLEDLLVQIYNQFDPDLAIGKVLDQRVAINGIQRQAGTHTTTNLTLTISQSLTLVGVDQGVDIAYTVADNAGTQWQLITTQNFAAPGIYVVLFQAKDPGATLTTPNTITVPVSVILGVDSINNPTTYATLGINEESDYNLRIRRQKSVSLSSQGYLAGLLAALENLTGMSAAIVYENNTGATDGDGIPSHSIWVIVSGTASASDIANAIYQKRNAGCGMKGTQFVNIVQADSTIFTIRWDNVVQQNLFIKFTAASLDGVNPPNIALIKSQLPLVFVPGVYEKVNINDLATAVQSIDNNCLVTNAGFSTTAGGSYTDTLTPTAKNNQWAVSSANTIVIPIIVNPTSAAKTAGQTQQFTSLGGYGAITWSIFTNVSGGTISPTGLYTAGATPGTDVIRATDSLGNFKAASVVVT